MFTVTSAPTFKGYYSSELHTVPILHKYVESHWFRTIC